jgi:hypothetical protein
VQHSTKAESDKEIGVFLRVTKPPNFSRIASRKRLTKKTRRNKKSLRTVVLQSQHFDFGIELNLGGEIDEEKPAEDGIPQNDPIYPPPHKEDRRDHEGIKEHERDKEHNKGDDIDDLDDEKEDKEKGKLRSIIL